ncbi:MAG: DUF721 domain-containing protein [Rhodobacteraceae bacterium]|nr:DUF721 domain-containing protein [Paracoccaceae bacterium]
MGQNMSTENSSKKRRGRGFASASSFAAAPLRTAAARRGMAETRLLTQWPAIAGPRLARLARPLRVKHDRGGHSLGGVLVLAVEGPRATEVEMEIPQIIERVNAHYGYRAIVDVALTQTAAIVVDAPARGAAGRPEAVEPPQLPSRKRQELEELTEPILDDALRSALTRLGANIMSRPKLAETATASTSGA